MEDSGTKGGRDMGESVAKGGTQGNDEGGNPGVMGGTHGAGRGNPEVAGDAHGATVGVLGEARHEAACATPSRKGAVGQRKLRGANLGDVKRW
ncbi:unnamed protein product [Ilex paraguariensis]|uniref:Uncharacterized protein n=1 Tax=Ilex paraguariensis TaxID=185542 RepID=A0ABC8SNK6_9AQUA